MLQSVLLRKTLPVLLFCFVTLGAAHILYAQSFLPVYQKGSGELITDLTIGGDVGGEEYLLSGPGRIAVDENGNIFVLDSRENHIKKFDAAGKYIKTFAKKGKGPGEILQAYQMGMEPDGNIVTWDLGNRRFSFFDNDGTFLHSIPFQEIIWGFKISPDGNFIVETHKWDFKNKKGTLIKVTRFSPDLKEKVPVDSAKIIDNKFITEPMRTNIPVPFQAQLIWDIAPNGNIVVALSGDYTIKIFSPAIKLIKQFQHNAAREKVTSADKKAYFDSMTSSVGGQIKKGAPDFIRKSTDFPKYKPYFTGIIIDHEGNILVRTFKTEKERSVYDIFSPDGNFICRTKLPPQLSFAVFKKGFIYAVRSSADGFPAVCRYKLK
ncbi:MAG TPA: 6-bladed beta-propeller [Bacteroidetes bacterium]|nr:6-bladed beta-propeller [Bacteroidota bacterium]